MASDATELRHLEPADVAARCVVYPKHFEGGEVFSKNALMVLDKLDRTKKPSYAISVVPRSLMVTRDDVHAYGCRTSARKNRRTFRDIGIEGGLDKRSFYCGFYEVEVQRVLDIPSPSYAIQVVIVPEGGEDAHSEIQLLPDTSQTPSELKAARGDILIALIRLLGGPVRGLCEEDCSYAKMISQLEMPTLPS